MRATEAANGVTGSRPRRQCGQSGALLCIVACLAACALGRPPALALTDEALGRLIITDDRPVTNSFVSRVEWLGDGKRIIVGGWQQWPNMPTVIAVMADGAVVPVAAGVANEHFAVSPDGTRVACWCKVGNGDMAQLAVAAPGQGPPTPIGPPVPAAQAMHIAWVSSDAPGTEWLVYILAEPQDAGGIYALSPTGVPARKLLQVSSGWWAGLFPFDGPDEILAKWLSKPPLCFRVNMRTGQWAKTDDFWVQSHPLPSKGPGAWLNDANSLLTAPRPEAVPTKLADRADGFCWSRSGRGLIYWTDDKLWVVSADGKIKRKLLGMPTLMPLNGGYVAYGCAWSPDESTVAYWRNAGGLGVLRRATLGTEEVAITFELPAGTKLPLGSAIWVAERFMMERPGVILKPEWRTCKGLFQVTRQTTDGQRTLVTAVNIGTEAGVLRRLTGSNDAPPESDTGAGHIAIGIGAAPTALVRSFTVTPLATIAAWPQGSSIAGRILRVDVTRRNLGI